MMLKNITSLKNTNIKNTSSLGKIWFRGKTRAIIILLITGIFLVNAGMLFAQKSKSTADKADSNLKSAAKVNPSTRAMEFSIPLGNYPGRGGNSMPFALSYSSKVWSMEAFQVRSQTSPLPNDTYKVLISTDINAIFGKKTTAGWTSSLQPPAIIEQREVYNQYGELYISADLPISSQKSYKNDSGTDVFITDDDWSCRIVDSWVGDDSSCALGVAAFYVEVCKNSITGIETPRIVTNTCIGNPYPDPTPLPTPNPNPSPISTPIPQIAHEVKRVSVQMPDGSSHEFRKNKIVHNCFNTSNDCQQTDDTAYNCDDYPLECDAGKDGTYLSVDGTRLRLERGEIQTGGEKRDVLYLPDGSRYIFPLSSQSGATNYLLAEKYIDVNGNFSTYDTASHEWTDTLARQIKDPLPDSFTGSHPDITAPQVVPLKGLDNQPDRNYQIVWKSLGDVIEKDSSGNPLATLKYIGQDTCQNVLMNPVSGSSLFTNQPGDPNTDPDGNRPNYQFERYQRVCAGSFGTPNLFNPAVMSELKLPDGQKYKFEYDEYGEITKITYPTGGYERFEYEEVPALGYSADEVYAQSNRGVKKREVSFDGASVSQTWLYHSDGATITITAPDGSQNIRSLHVSTGTAFGFENPLAGMPLEEATIDTAGQLRSRTLTEYTATPPTGQTIPPDTQPFPEGSRDARPVRQISIIFENNQALATMSETDYENPAATSPPTDPRYFARLNAKQTKSYHFLTFTNITTARNGNLAAIKDLFNASGQVSGISQTDYQYDANYLTRGMTSLPTDTRSLDPSTNVVIAKSHTSYDESGQAYSLNDSTTTTNHTTPPGGNLAPRGNATTSQVWVKETDGWLTTHTQYDNFGNPIKSWDVNGNTSSIQYDPVYKYAYPTTITSSVPDDGTHGSNQAFTTSTAYDFTTGLPTSTTDANNLVTQTRYTDPTSGAIDPLLRVRQVIAPNGQQTVTEYGVPDASGHFPAEQRFVKVKTQIDATNWKQGYTWFDGLGRTVKTQSIESSGDVFAETRYDQMGRAFMTTNPYRTGEPILWSLTEFDAAGRVRQSRAPVANQDPANPTGDVLGVTSYAISTAQDYVGAVVTGTDAAGRRSRSITNALGQVLRVDEATGMNHTTEAADLGSPDSPLQPTVYKYNLLGKMTEVTQGDQKRYFMYDSLGRLIRVRQPEQQINPNLNTTGNLNNNSWTSAFEYDALGNVKSTTDARGVRTITDYDNTSRVKTRCYTKPNQGAAATGCGNLAAADTDPNTPQVDYYYDGIYLDANNNPQTAVGAAKGALTQVKNSISRSQTTNFDAFGRPLTYQQLTDGQTYPTTYTYNLSGSLQLETYPSGRTVKNDFDADGNLARISGKANRLVAEQTYASGFTYTSAGAIERLQLGNGRWENAKFNNRLQITELGLGTSATNLNLWKVNYDYGEIDAGGALVTTQNTGNIAKQTISFDGLAQPFVQTYKYDSLNRLADANETSGVGGTQTWQQIFKYDRYGNRLRTGSSKQIGSSYETQTNLTFPTVDQNTTTNKFSTGQGYTYDANGNIIADPVDNGRGFVFNGDNKQTEVRDANNNLIGKYYYDGAGKRVKKEFYSAGDNINPLEQTVFVYSGGKMIAEYSTTPPTDPTTSYVATDILQSVRAISNTNGDVIARRDFMPFGEDITVGVGGRTGDTGQKYSSSKDKTRQKFTGYQKDEETKLDFAEARYYNNAHGRFTAVDPLLASGKSANPQTFNRYVYTMNNPLAYTDPSGMQVGTHVGKVYTDENETRYMPDPFDESHQFQGAKYVEGADGFTYSVTTDGFYSIGNTADINARGARFADSQVREQAHANSSLPSSWIPELQIDPPGYEEASHPSGGRFTVTADGDTDPMAAFRQTDNQRAFALGVAIIGGLGQVLGSSGNPPSIPKGFLFTGEARNGSNFGEKLFLTETFGKDSKLFGNSRFDLSGSRREGLLNQSGSNAKVGWSSPLRGGGWQFRFGFLEIPNSRQAQHHFNVPGTFVPNSFADQYQFRAAKRTP